MRRRIIILLISWAALLVPGIVASELVRSYANRFIAGLPDLASVDRLQEESKGRVDDAASKLGDAAKKFGLGDAVDKLKGEAEEKVGEVAQKAADAGAQKISEQVIKIRDFCSVSFPMFQLKLLGLSPTISIIILAGLGILSFGFLYCGRPHVKEEE